MRAPFIVAAAALVTACHSNGNAEEPRATAQRDFPVGAFDRIALSGSPDVVVTVGGQPSVHAEGDAQMIERLEVTVENGQLRVGYRNNSNWFSWGHHGGVTLHVTVPSLTAAEIGGSGDMRIDRIQAQRFAGSIAGSGDMQIGTMAVGEAAFSVTGSGGIRAAGHAERASAAVTGSGDIDLAALEAADAALAITGSGDIGIRATRTADVQIRGSGDVTVAGPARCTINKSGSGDVRCNGA